MSALPATHVAAVACPLCGAPNASPRYQVTDRLFRTTNRVFNLLECDACRTLFMWPLPAVHELDAAYPAGYWWRSGDEGGIARTLEGAYRRAVLGDHIRFLVSAVGPAPARVLDLGCGSGDVLAALVPRGYRCVGMDASQPALRAAMRQGVPAVIADYHTPAVRAASFDAVSMFHFLEHVPDPRLALDFARHALRPGGRLVVQVPNAASWQRALLGSRWSGLDAPRHLVNYSRAALERLVSGAGFRIRRRKHFSLRDNAPALATSVAPGLEPVSRRLRRDEAVPVRLALDLVYFAMVLGALPFAVVEAAAGRGATIMLEAERC